MRLPVTPLPLFPPLYVKGWPTCMPTTEEARLLASVRRNVADYLGLAVGFTDPDDILGRYAELMARRPSS